MNVVVDASALVEYLLRTQIGKAAAGVLEQEAIFAPELIDAEVLAVIRRLLFKAALTPRRADEALADLAAMPAERLPHRQLLADAWALRAQVSAYDALYVAAAKQHHAMLLTADGPLSRAHGLGIVVQNLRD